MNRDKIIKHSQRIKVTPNRTSEAIQRDLENNTVCLDRNFYDPAFYSSRSIFRLCSQGILREMIKMMYDNIPSRVIATYLYQNVPQIRERYKKQPAAKSDIDGIPTTIARSVRLLRHKVLAFDERYPTFAIDVVLKKELLKLDVVKEILELYCLQKQRIDSGHELECNLGMMSHQVSQDIVILRQLLLDYVKICQALGIELPTSFQTMEGYSSEDHHKTSAEVVEKLDAIGADPYVQELLDYIRKKTL